MVVRVCKYKTEEGKGEERGCGEVGGIEGRHKLLCGVVMS